MHKWQVAPVAICAGGDIRQTSPTSICEYTKLIVSQDMLACEPSLLGVPVVYIVDCYVLSDILLCTCIVCSGASIPAEELEGWESLVWHTKALQRGAEDLGAALYPPQVPCLASRT